jgi:hypothetical protein
MRSAWKLLLAFAFLVPVIVLGEGYPVILPSPSPSILPAAGALWHWADLVKAFTAGGLVLSIGAAIEFVLRVIPSQKPLSVGYAIADLLHAFGDLSRALGDALDKVLPNRLKIAPPKPNDAERV